MSEHIVNHHLADPLSQDMTWSRHAICETADPDLFFPQPGADTSYARSMCRACPVRSECLDYALATKQKFGIWGGMTESQRRRLRREDHTANHPARPRAVVAAVVAQSARPHLVLVR